MTSPAQRVAYLDNAATTPLRPEVAEAMAPFGSARFGNPSGSHSLARDARLALEEAREVVAEALGAAPAEVVFTSGGTEADNLAILGTLGAQGPVESGGAVVCSAVEHAAVLEPCRAAAKGLARVNGVPPIEVREAPVDADGAVVVDALEELLGPEVLLVSVMLANNEVGTLQPLDEVAAVVRKHAPRAVLHTDAVQAAGWLDVAECALSADLVSVSAHKLGGPKGTGALVVRAPVAIEPILYGGGQERERRSGTHDVAGAVGLATALRAGGAGRESEGARVRDLRDRLADGLLKSLDCASESADRARVLPGHCHLRFAGVEQEELLMLLDQDGVAAAGGAACASGALEPSHVLRAMGVPPDEARSAVRFSLGHATTVEDVDHALAVVPGAVSRLLG